MLWLGHGTTALLARRPALALCAVDGDHKHFYLKFTCSLISIVELLVFGLFGRSDECLLKNVVFLYIF